MNQICLEVYELLFRRHNGKGVVVIKMCTKTLTEFGGISHIYCMELINLRVRMMDGETEARQKRLLVLPLFLNLILVLHLLAFSFGWSRKLKQSRMYYVPE